MILFQTERLIVRHYTWDDNEHFYEFNSNADVMRYIRPVKNRPEAEVFLKQVLSETLKDPYTGRWAVETKEGGAIVGSFAVIPVDHSDKMQLGYALMPPFWGKGFATELVVEGLKYVQLENKIPEIYAITEIENGASRHVLLKTGFRQLENLEREGKELAFFIYEF